MAIPGQDIKTTACKSGIGPSLSRAPWTNGGWVVQKNDKGKIRLGQGHDGNGHKEKKADELD